MSDLDVRREECITALRSLAHRLGWNGVENSKILHVFLENYIEEQQAEIAGLKVKE
jgi:hypothetical protein